MYADIDILLEDVELDSMIDASVGFMVPIDTVRRGTFETILAFAPCISVGSHHVYNIASCLSIAAGCRNWSSTLRLERLSRSSSRAPIPRQGH